MEMKVGAPWIAPSPFTLVLSIDRTGVDLPTLGSDDFVASNWTALINEDRDVLEREALPKLGRIIGLRCVVAMGNLPKRLAIHCNAGERVAGVDCG
jgi:hypothetical protein